MTARQNEDGRSARVIKPVGALRITITDEQGAEVDAPAEVYRLTREVLSIVAEGCEATVLAVDHDLSTQDAADILGMSRPHLIKLLEQRAFPHYLVGSHRRVRVEDVLAYKRRRDAQRSQALDDLAAESQDLRLY